MVSCSYLKEKKNMKRFLKITGKIVGALVAIVLVFVVYIEVSYNRTFQAPPTGITASRDTAVIARGRYIVKGPHTAGRATPARRLLPGKATTRAVRR
jgi:hypothetical protein